MGNFKIKSIEDVETLLQELNEFIQSQKKATKIKHFTDVKTFEDACKYSGDNPDDILRFRDPETDEDFYYDSLFKLRYISNVIRGDWKPNWSDKNETKYYAYFRYDPKTSAFVFLVTGYVWTDSNSTVGSRLCFPSSEMAEYFGKQFIDLHNQILLK